jgi:hypothetical protein
MSTPRKPRKRMKCECGYWFTQRWASQAFCLDCVHLARVRLSQRRHDPTKGEAWAVFRKTLETALQPFYGRPETAPIVTAILGAFASAKKEEAA